MPMASGCRRGTEECAVPPLGTGMQAIQLSPYRTGVAGRSHTRLRAAPAFHPCSCPLLLSDSGKVVASQSFALNFGHLWWQCTRCAPRRTLSSHTAHERGDFTGNFHFTNSTDFTVVSLRIRWLPLYRFPHPLPQGLCHVRGFPAFRLLCPI